MDIKDSNQISNNILDYKAYMNKTIYMTYKKKYPTR